MQCIKNKNLNLSKTNMTQPVEVKELDQVVVRFSGDSGDGMQLAGNIFSTVSAIEGNSISTFPDYPADIRAPQGSLTGVSGFQVHIGAEQVYTPGDKCDVLVCMNAAALKTQYQFAKPSATIIIDIDSFREADLKKAEFKTNDYLAEMNIDPDRVVLCPLTTMVKHTLEATGMDNKAMLKCRNMFAVGLVCWLFNRDLNHVFNYLHDKFAKKPDIAEANCMVVRAGFDYGHNIHANVPNTYRIETKHKEPGRYMDITGNKATAYGLMAAAEKAGLQLYLGSYPITPATDILHELAKHKSMGVITVQCEDEIAAASSAIGAAFGGALAVTSTSGPGMCLKSEAINLAVMLELPLVIIDVQRGGPSTGLPTKTEQTDLLQALYGRNGDSPVPVIAATSPTNCFDAAYNACKMALERMTPVILLTDAYIANGSAAWRLPKIEELPPIELNRPPAELKDNFLPYKRNPWTYAPYWAIPGQEGYQHIIGGLEKQNETGVISTDPQNHDLMCSLRRKKLEEIKVPNVPILGDKDNAELLLIGFGGTYGHLHAVMDELRKEGHKVALAQLEYIYPLPENIVCQTTKYPMVAVVEQNNGQLASYLRANNANPMCKINEITGQPLNVGKIIEHLKTICKW